MTETPQPPEPQKPPAGYYPDSTGAQRYWDGNAWGEMAPATPPQAPSMGSAPTAPAATPAYASAPAPKKSHVVRNVILIILALIVLSFVGCMALVGGAINEADNAIDAAEKKDKEPGGPDNPLAIKEGKAFDVSGFAYSKGWKVKDDGFGSIEIVGLKVTNNRDKKDSALVELKFMKGSEVLALTDCTTEPVAVGETTTLSCLSGDELPKKYDKITINDTF